MALEGTLRDFSLADILQLISLQHKTGLLTVRGPADTVTLGFLDGMLVSAESSAQRLDTRLGTVLVKTRRLTAEALARALEMQAQTLQRLGFILLKNGFCSAQDLRDGLDIQIKRIAYGLFRWTDGDYVFEQTEQVDYDAESTTPIAVERLLMEGARMIDEWPIVEKVVWSLDIVYQKVPDRAAGHPCGGRGRRRGRRGLHARAAGPREEARPDPCFARRMVRLRARGRQSNRRRDERAGFPLGVRRMQGVLRPREPRAHRGIDAAPRGASHRRRSSRTLPRTRDRSAGRSTSGFSAASFSRCSRLARSNSSRRTR